MVNVDNLDFVKRCMQVMTKPSQFFRDKFTEELSTPALHIIFVSLISSAFSIILSVFINIPLQIMMGENVLSAIGGIIFGGIAAVIAAPILGLIGWIIGGSINHLFVMLVGGKGGWKRTLKIIAYMSTVNILGPIPVVGFLAGFYGIYLAWVGYQKQHKLTGGRAAIAIILPIAIMIVIAIIFAAAIIAAIAALGLGAMGGLEGLEALANT